MLSSWKDFMNQSEIRSILNAIQDIHNSSLCIPYNYLQIFENIKPNNVRAIILYSGVPRVSNKHHDMNLRNQGIWLFPTALSQHVNVIHNPLMEGNPLPLCPPSSSKEARGPLGSYWDSETYEGMGDTDSDTDENKKLSALWLQFTMKLFKYVSSKRYVIFYFQSTEDANIYTESIVHLTSKILIAPMPYNLTYINLSAINNILTPEIINF